MENTEQKVPLWGPAGIYEARPDEVETLLGGGYQPATEEQIKFSTTPEAIKGYGEAVGRGLGGAFFTAAERALGVDPQSIENRRQISVGENAALATELATMAVPIGVIGKVARAAELGQAVSPLLSAAEKVSKFTFPGAIDVAGNLASRGIEGAAAKLAMKYGVENALFSVSDDFGKKLVSDKPEDVNEVLSGVLAHAALSGIVGAGIGAGVGKVSELWKAKQGSKVAETIDQIKRDSGPDLPPITSEAAPITEKELATKAPETVSTTFESPQTVEELKKLSQELGEIPLEPFEAPERKSLDQAIETLGPEKLKVPISNAQLEAVSDPVAKKVIENARAIDPEIDKAFAIIEGHQKAQSEQGIWGVIKKFSPNFIREPLEAGKKWTKKIVDNVFKASDYFETQFRRFDEMAVNGIETTADIFNKLEQQFPGVKNLFSTTKDGAFKLKPWKINMPITKETHAALSELLPLLKEGEQTIGQIRNARKNIYSFINFGNKESQMQINQIRNVLMDAIQGQIEKIDPSFEIKKLFTDYATHKEALDMAESLLGSALSKEGPKDQFLASEKLVKSLFSDTGKIGFLKQLLPKEEFNELLGDYLAIALQNTKKEGAYSSRLFGNWLKREMPELLSAFGDEVGSLNELEAWNTIAKLIPDGVRMFPSRSGEQAFQTTKPFFGKILSELKSLGAWLSLGPQAAATAATGKAAAKISEAVSGKLAQKEQEMLLNQLLSGTEKQAGAASILRTIKDWSKNTNAAAFEAMRQYFSYAAKGTYLINKEVRNIFDEQAKPTIKPMSKKELDRLDRKVQSLANNPEELLNVGGNVGYYAPEHATAMGMVSARAVQYLASKKPAPKKNGPLDREIPPSVAQVNDYYRTLETAENPVKILQRIKDGTLHSRDIVDFKNLYPELYNIFVQKVSNEMVNAQTKGKPMPYQIRKGLSLFSGMPMDSNMQPQSIQAAQATYQPQQQPQAQLPQMAKKSSRVSKLPSLTETDQQRRMLKQ